MDSAKWLQDHWAQYTNDLRALVAHPSVSRPTGDASAPFGEACGGVLAEALSLGERMGFAATNHENYCGTLLWKGASAEEIGIFGHLDVVPEGQDWRYPPYELTVLDDKFVARGVNDNKGPALIALYALKYLKDSGYAPRHSIRYFFGINEENGMQDIEYYVAHNDMPVFSFTPDAAFPVCHGEKGVLEIEATFDLGPGALVAFESGDASNIVPAHASATLAIDPATVREALKGRDDLTITESKGGTTVTARGIAAHAAFPEGSRSAQVVLAGALADSGLLDGRAARFMRASATLFADYNGAGIGIPYEDQSSGKLTHVGGMAHLKDGVITQNINIRYPVTTHRGQMIDQLTHALAAEGFTLVRVHDSAPCFMEPTSPVVQALTDICNRELGLALTPYVMGGGTYARKLKNAVGYGPGIPDAPRDFGPTRGGGHQSDEYIAFDHLRKSFEIYVKAIRAIDQLV